MIEAMYRHSLAIAPLLICSSVAVAQAHIALLSPAPRTSAQKIGPCGSGESVRGAALSYRPGETITVEWDETVNHPGHYRISLNMDGQEFQLPNQPTDDFPETLVDQIADKDGGLYSQEITFPDQECDNCTLQLMQIMTTNVPYNSFYFQCADIVLSNSAPASPDAGEGTVDPPGTGAGATGSGCSTTGTSGGTASWLALAMMILIGRRSRKRAH
jgi:MYXO-CTERM domain-containing protein